MVPEYKHESCVISFSLGLEMGLVEYVERWQEVPHDTRSAMFVTYTSAPHLTLHVHVRCRCEAKVYFANNAERVPWGISFHRLTICPPTPFQAQSQRK
jgi:hypothetical protein